MSKVRIKHTVRAKSTALEMSQSYNDWLIYKNIKHKSRFKKLVDRVERFNSMLDKVD